jgi:acyl-CoA synthetase (AMP-forming)/AMP-acid ligase II
MRRALGVDDTAVREIAFKEPAHLRAASPQPAPRGRNPFDVKDVERGPDGILRYADRPPSLVHMLRASVEADPAAAALVELGGGSLAYGQLWERAARVAGGLRAAGVGRGDRIAIRLPNGIDWVLAFFGAQLAGAIAVPVNTRFTDDEVAYVQHDSGSVFTFAAGQSLPDGPPTAVEDLEPDDVAAIFYTSGTTGVPKGAMVAHANFIANSESGLRGLGVDRSAGPAMATLVAVPLFHVAGCSTQLISFLDRRGRVEMLSSPLDFDGLFEAIRDHGVNHLVAVPAIYHVLLHHPGFANLDVSRIRWVLYGAAPIDTSLVHRLEGAFPDARLGNGFGLTETAGVACSLPHEEAAAHADSVGFAVPVVDLAIDDADPGSGVGELLVRGPNVVPGYWNNAAATAETIVDGWLRTGDLGRVDADGLLHVVDRKKDMINRGGENVYSLEVENALAGAPGVAELAVLAVPDEMMGEKVGMVIVPTAGTRPDLDAILARARERLADFKVPQYAAIRPDPLPRNASLKVLKTQLREHTDWGRPLF